MQFSVQVTNHNHSWEALEGIARAVDQGSWHALWNYDHLVPPMAEMLPHVAEDLRLYEEADCFEGWSVLSAWAALTRRVRLGVLVTAMPFRNPALLAKMAVTADHVSRGRVNLGVGAAWHVGEARAYGIPLGGAREKLDRFEEGLKVLKLLLSGQTRVDFEGQHYRLDDAPFAPGPVGPMPILIGGGGEKRTLRLVAEYADVYNFFVNGLATREVYLQKNRVLDEHCAAIGRDPRSIQRSVALFADVIEDEARARAAREFLAGPMGDEVRDNLLFGSAQYVLDGFHRLLDGVEVDEVIFCGLGNHPEAYQRFDEQVLRRLQPSGVGA